MASAAAHESEYPVAVFGQRFDLKPDVGRIDDECDGSAGCGNRVFERYTLDGRAQQCLRGKRRDTVLRETLAIEARTHDEFNVHERCGAVLLHDRRHAARAGDDRRSRRRRGRASDSRNRQQRSEREEGVTNLHDAESFAVAAMRCTTTGCSRYFLTTDATNAGSSERAAFQ